MGSDDADDFIFSQELLRQLLAEVDRALSGLIELSLAAHAAEVVADRVGPNEVAEGAFERDFHIPVDCVDLLYLQSREKYFEQLIGDATMDAEKFTIHQARQGEGIKGQHEFFIDLLAVLG